MKMANPHKVFGALAPVRPNDLPINLSAANRVFQCNTAQISDWAEASGLDPIVDFRNRDLRGLRFAGHDLSGFDFQGSKVDNNAFEGAKIDETTRLPEGYDREGERGSLIPLDEFRRALAAAAELFGNQRFEEVFHLAKAIVPLAESDLGQDHEIVLALVALEAASGSTSFRLGDAERAINRVLNRRMDVSPTQNYHTVNNPPRVLVVDDSETSREVIVRQLRAEGYETSEAADGEQALAAVSEYAPDLILVDATMPKLNGIEVCRRLKSDSNRPFTPIIILSAKTDTSDVVASLDAGADEYLTKPIDRAALVARVKSVMRLKELHGRVQAQADDFAKWNRSLEQRVAEHVAEIERVGRLKRFLPPQLAQLIVASRDERILESRRREITVLFCDLRGFTAFAETAEPEEVLKFLREYHAALGILIDKFEGTVERFAGDGLLVVFNDPVPCPNPSERAVQMAIEMRDEVARLATKWRYLGYELGFGVGIAHGYATLGIVGSEGRFQYSVTGKVANLAARLCDEAGNSQILVDANVHRAIENRADVEVRGELVLKGFSQPVKAFIIRS